jgi:hypothetical protein
MGVLPPLCRVLIAAVFLTSAIAKLRSFRDVRTFLVPVFRGWSTGMARIVLAGEILLATTLLVFWHSESPGWLVVIAMAGFSAFYAIRLVVADDTKCGCWGVGTQVQAQGSLGQSIMRPVNVVARNSAIACAGFIIATRHSPVESVLFVGLMMATGIEVLVASGLFASILRKRMSLRRGQHRLVAVYAPRWAYVKGCRTVSLNESGPSTIDASSNTGVDGRPGFHLMQSGSLS